MKKYHSLIALTISILWSSCSQQHQNPLGELTDQRIHSLNMFLYPSTIRMINLSKNESFYEATKGIERLQFISIDLTKTKYDSIFHAWEAKQDFTDWDELFNATIAGNKSVIYTPKDAENVFFASIKTEEGVNLVWAEGTVNLKEAMNIMNGGLDLGPVSNFLDQKDKDKKKREVWKKAREEQRKLEEEDSKKKEKELD